MQFLSGLLLLLGVAAKIWTAEALFFGSCSDDICQGGFLGLFQSYTMCCNEKVEVCTWLTGYFMFAGCTCGPCYTSGECCKYDGGDFLECADVEEDNADSLSLDRVCNEYSDGESCAWDYSGDCCKLEVSDGLTGTVDGSVVYFNNGNWIPAGNYIIEYKDGCMKFGLNHFWTVNGHSERTRWWLVGSGGAGDKIKKLPGTIVSFDRDGNVIDGGHTNFFDCVEANKELQSLYFTHSGGKLGIWVEDDKYWDNGEGVDGRNPTYTLHRNVC